MFYVKKKFEGGGEINIPIDYDNVFTLCPKCGAEHEVDLSALWADGDFDICDTRVYCKKCSGNHANSETNEDEMDFGEKIQIIEDTRNFMAEGGEDPENIAVEIKKLCEKFNIDPLIVLAYGGE